MFDKMCMRPAWIFRCMLAREKGIAEWGVNTIKKKSC